MVYLLSIMKIFRVYTYMIIIKKNITQISISLVGIIIIILKLINTEAPHEA